MSKKDILYKPKDYSNFNLTFPEVDKLIDVIELIKRRKIKDNDVKINYIDPFNHVKTLLNPVNHLIIGRRGSGKTSLLIKVIEEIRKREGIITIIDMQGKQRKSSDLQLTEILIILINELKNNLESLNKWEPYINRITKVKYYKLKSIYYKLFKKENIWSNKDLELDRLYQQLILILEKLDTIKLTPNGANIKINKSTISKRNFNSSNSIKAFLNFDSEYLKLVNLNLSSESTYTIVSEDSHEKTFEFTSVYSKQDALNHLKDEIIDCLIGFNKVFNKPIYLILDDFYQIPIYNQPYIFQYLHDLNKETINMSFSYKVCLVPNRFKLNEDDNKILSHKDDFSTINLDREFYDLEANKDLLFKILCSLDPKLNFTTSKITKLFNDTLVLNDCIRASGALPRYFLDVFSHMIKFSKAENQTKIHRMVLSQVVREIKKSKDGLIAEEAYLPEDQIRKLYNIIEEEVIHGLQTNVILYPYISFKENEDVLNTLINLGYIHRIKESIIVEKINYAPLFIDMIFTHTKSDKMPKNFKDVKFWDQDGKILHKCLKWEFSNDKLNGILNVSNFSNEINVN